MESLELTAEGVTDKELAAKVQKDAGVDAKECYQCGKCTAGCPVAFSMDYVPRKILRLVQMGLMDQALHSKTIWLCVGCDTCSTRCPRNVDIAKMMETLRVEAIKRGITPEKDTNLFNELFLKSVEKYGRVHEFSLMMEYNIRSGHLMQDAAFAPKLFQTGKVSILPERVNDGGAIKRIFAKAKAKGGEK